MAADVVASDASNPCCAELKKKYLKVKNDLKEFKNVLKLIESRFQLLCEEKGQLKKDFGAEKLRADQEREEEKMRELRDRQQLEKEIHDLKKELSICKEHKCLNNVDDDEMQLLKARVFEAENEIKRLKVLLEKEKRKSELELKKANSEKSNAAEAWKLVKKEKKQAEEERKLVETEKKKSEEYMFCLEKAKSEAVSLREKLKSEISKVEDARKKVEAERQKMIVEKTRADSQAKLVAEQRRLVEAERKKAIEEKIRADHLSKMLEEEKINSLKLQNKIEDIESTSKGKVYSFDGEKRDSADISILSAKMMLLKEKNKFEKKQAKHAKRMARLEKAEKSYIMQEHQILRHSFMDLLTRFNLLDARLSHSIEGTDAATKNGKSQDHGFKKKSNLTVSKRTDNCSKVDCGLKKTCCSCTTNLSEPARELVSTKQHTGIISELERNKSQSSAICSNTSFSDKRSMGSQERDSVAIIPLTRTKSKHPNKRPAVLELPNEVINSKENKKNIIVAGNVGRCYGHDLLDRRSKRRKIQETTESKQSSLQIGEKLFASKEILSIEPGVSAQTCSNDENMTQNEKFKSQRIINPHGNEPDDLISFEKMISGNCLKLLDLDSIDDEEKYRMAVAMPLSPTLPIFKIPNHLAYENDAQYVMEKEKPLPDNLIRNLSSVTNVQNKACGHVNNTNSEGVDNAPAGITTSTKNQVLNPETRTFQKIHGVENTRPNGFLPEASKQPTLYCVVHSDIKDMDSISKIFCMRNTFSHQNFTVSQIDHLVVQVHNALATNGTLLPQEKASAFFSLLLCNISSRMSVNFKWNLSEYLLQCSETFATEIKKVLSDTETKSLFKEICNLDILSGIVDKFLIERKVLIYQDKLNECSDTSFTLFQCDGTHVLSKAATIDQFIAGCIILASISSAANQIGFLLETSYKILRTCGTEGVSWILLALHVFALVSGKDFFAIDEFKLLIIALKSVVLFVERGPNFVSSCFSPCDECPFAAGAICMDKLTTLLLDVLQCFISSGAGYQNLNNSDCISVNIVRIGESNVSKEPFCLVTFKKHAADLPDCFPERAYCHFNDIISLVELIGCYMSWEWTNEKVIPCITKMLESCTIEEFSIALVVLKGQLGRFGIDAGGQHIRGTAELRHSISLFIDKSPARRTSLRTQFAAIGALLNLLPISFNEIVGNYENLLLDVDQANHVNQIKIWFLGLSKQQQSLCHKLFEQAKN